MGRKPSYTVVEEEEHVTVTKAPKVVRMVPRLYRQGAYFWLPKEWGDRPVIIMKESYYETLPKKERSRRRRGRPPKPQPEALPVEEPAKEEKKEETV